MTTHPQPLDLAGPLPTGTVVLEASAGTGKTYAIAALATRAVAEGRCTLPELLLVTFTRAATAELRDRVRQRLAGAEAHLRAHLEGTAPDPGDDVVLAHLADADPRELRTRHGRLQAALTDFDAATISTIHGFTQQVLRSVGLAVDVPREATLLDDQTQLLDEVLDDVYLRRYLTDGARPGRPKRSELRHLAQLLARHPDAAIAPDPDVPVGDDDAAAQAAERAACARELAVAIAARKRADAVLSHDDLLHALRRALDPERRGAQARAVLRRRYRWALIDEFQDTDPVQWDILDGAFRDPDDPDRALVLIGDPKQAIYGFRGADVRAYLTATTLADQRRELATNFRSDPALLTALDRLLAGTRFGDERIAFRAVAAADRHRHRHVRDAADPAALQLRVHPDGDRPGADAARAAIAADLAATLSDQLGRVEVGDPPRTLRPRDVAVLVRTNDEARLVQETLVDAGIPAVVNGVGSVLATRATDDWRWLLDALERPSDPGRVRRLALTCWVGWGADRLGGDPGDDLDRLHDDVARWAQTLADHGVAALQRQVTVERRVAERLLGETGGERHLTDLRHIGQLLHLAEREEDRGVAALRSWLLTARDEAGDTATPTDEQARRLESDAEAVQIATIHRSKGLQYPLVCVPFSWSAGQTPQFPLAVHTPEGGRVVDVGPRQRHDADAVLELARREQLGEQLRLLYVAVTRAQHRAVVWWAPVRRAEHSPLARVLFRGEGGTVDLEQPASLPSDPVATLTDRFAGTATSVTLLDPHAPAGDGAGWHGTDLDPTRLQAAVFDRTVDLRWRRTSYSALLRRAADLDPHDDVAEAVTSEPDVAVVDDEPPADATPADAPPVAAATATPGAADHDPLPLGRLSGGAAFGTLVHAVLEHVDFTVDDLPATLRETVREQRRWHRVPGLDDRDLAPLADGLAAAVTTPLGPLAAADGQRRLADVAPADRLDEVEFELPLAGGDDATTAATLADVAALLARPAADGGLADDDPLRDAGYPERLRRLGAELDLRGYLTGSIDLLLRVERDGAPCYLVADHKTNRLGEATPPDYHPDRLVDAMVHGDYPLQALLYLVAAHRYLRWRQPGYDVDVHLGGALYLFLRGMSGPDVPTVDGRPHGVHGWRPPGRLVADVSDLLDRAADDADRATPDLEAADPATQETLW